MKMNYKNVVKVSIGFSIVMLFWYGYDFVVPLLLDNIFGLPDHLRGLVMGFDNLLSIMLIPLFGRLSDKTNTRFGKRKPFVFVGTIMAVLLMVFVPLSANMQLDDATELRQQIVEETDEQRLEQFYEDSKQGENTKYCDVAFLKRSGISKEEYASFAEFTTYEKVSEGIVGDDKYYQNTPDGKIPIKQEKYEEMEQKYDIYVKPGLNTYISDEIYENITSKDFTPLIVYLVILFFVLVAMASFRSPTVALMPDITPKPFRSQANAIVNLAGGAGAGIAFFIYTIWFAFRPYPYVEIFATMGGAMIIL